ncbi:MAG TPA: hypothetical protein PKL97_08300, partial [Candidatus Omnitrophota bacterium]|nr:hypothetical protein [Candidatus Omnitrophota bacterium]
MPASQNSLSEKIWIPEELGRIEEIYSAPNDGVRNARLVIYLKDAHANYEAQCRIRDILRKLHGDFGIGLIAVEGASTRLDRSQMEFFADRETNLRIANFLAEKGELSGADLFVLEKEGVDAEGVESPDAYLENLNVFRQVHGADESRDRFMALLDGQVDLVSAKLLPKQLRRLAKAWQRLERREGDVANYVRLAAEQAKAVLKLDLSDPVEQLNWPQLTRILKLRNTEPKFDAKAIEQEQTKLADFLRGIDAKDLAEDLEALNSRKSAEREASGTLAASSEGVSPRLLYEKIFTRASSGGFDFSRYPAYGIFARFLILQSEVESRKLFAEIETLSEKLFDALARTPEEKDVLRFIRDVHFLRQLLSLELVRDKLRMITEEKENLSPAKMLDRLESLKRVARVSNHKEEGDRLAPQLLPAFERAFLFYAGAEKREDFLVANTLRLMEAKKKETAVLITGGFHSSGIREKLAEEGVSYLVISPNFKVKDNENQYLDVMMNRRALTLECSLIAAPDKTNPALYFRANPGPLRFVVKQPDGSEQALSIPRKPSGELAVAADLGTPPPVLTPADLDAIRKGLDAPKPDLKPFADTMGRLTEGSSLGRRGAASLIVARTPRALRPGLAGIVRQVRNQTAYFNNGEGMSAEGLPVGLSLGELSDQLANALADIPSGAEAGGEQSSGLPGGGGVQQGPGGSMGLGGPVPAAPPLIDNGISPGGKGGQGGQGVFPAGGRQGAFTPGGGAAGRVPPVFIGAPLPQPVTLIDIESARGALSSNPPDLGPVIRLLERLAEGASEGAPDVNELIFSRVPPRLAPDFARMLRETESRLEELEVGPRTESEKKFPEGLLLGNLRERLEIPALDRPPVPGLGKLIGPEEIELIETELKGGGLGLESLREVLGRLGLGDGQGGLDITEVLLDRVPRERAVEFIRVVNEMGKRVNERGAEARGMIPAGLDLGGLQRGLGELYRENLLAVAVPGPGEEVTELDLVEIGRGLRAGELDLVPMGRVLGRVLGELPRGGSLSANEIIFSRVPERLVPEFERLVVEAEDRLNRLGGEARARAEQSLPEGVSLGGLRDLFGWVIPAMPPVPGMGKLVGPEEIALIQAELKGGGLGLESLREVLG